ncbi:MULTISPECIES: hypothetical protein [unclassified Nocardioides]|uniref:hypothetical protein n=1 Tax=unclassified Nocardioides TaxID=2615069 RepID=UPI0012E3B0D9|nr:MULTISPECIES: hypothetical protein [unclassified Nocardioides]
MDSHATIAHLLVDQKLREAQDLYAGRELQRSRRATTETSPVESSQQPRQHSRLWTLVHFRHAFG